MLIRDYRVKPDDGVNVVRLVDNLDKAGCENVELALVDADGDDSFVELSLSNLDDLHVAIGEILLANDVSPRCERCENSRRLRP